MENVTNPIKSKCMEALTCQRHYVKTELAYLRYMMKQLGQEELADCLNTLTMKELKIALAAGVPGKCMHLANQLLVKYKENMDMYLEDDGNKATMRLDSLDDEGLVIEDEKPGVQDEKHHSEQ